MKKYFVNTIRYEILKHIYEHNNDIKLDIARDIDVTFSQINKILKEEFLPLGLIKPFRKEGRKVYLNLTKKGMQVLELAAKLKEVLEEKQNV